MYPKKTPQKIVRLEERLEETRECDDRIKKAKEHQNRCTAERKAYQRSLIECGNKGFEIDDAEQKVKKCDLELLACRLPDSSGKRKNKRTKPRGRRPIDSGNNNEDAIPHVVGAEADTKTKDPVYDESSLLARLMGMGFVISLAVLLIYGILYKS